jgi:hypothetical protein
MLHLLIRDLQSKNAVLFNFKVTILKFEALFLVEICLIRTKQKEENLFIMIE